MSFECPKCNNDVEMHTNNFPTLHPMKEEYANLYGRICPYCGFFIPADKKPKIVEKNLNKLKLMKQKVRELIRKRLFFMEQDNVNKSR